MDGARGGAVPDQNDGISVTDSADLLASLQRAVGPDHVVTDPDLVSSYVTDWTRRFSGPAAAVARPASTAEVAAVVAVCAYHDAVIVPQGGNTGLVGGSVPRAQSHRTQVVLSLARLNQLAPVDLTAAQVTVGAGVTIADLHAHAADAGFSYGVDLAARASATVGGTIATNAGGIRVVRHGATREQVAGIEAVLADGSIISRLSGLTKDNVGYDLPGLLVGSEGTLAVVTRARMRLVKEPEHRVVALLAIGSVADAVAGYMRLRDYLDVIEAVEYIEHPGVELVVETGARRPFAADHPAYLLVEVAGRTDPTPALAEAVADAPEIRDAAVARDKPNREQLWRLREGHTVAIGRLGVPHKLDVALPLAELASFRSQLDAAVEAAAPGARTVVFGHVGDGNLHVNVVGPAPDDDAVDAAVFSLVAAHRGSISAEHGIGVHKAPYVSLGRNDADVAAMRALKQAFDPQGVLNPGVLFE